MLGGLVFKPKRAAADAACPPNQAASKSSVCRTLAGCSPRRGVTA
jgi:hypothetical protein